MQKTLFALLFIAIFFALGLDAQTPLARQHGAEKGVKALYPSAGHPTGTKRAVVVGISDYQNENISDLQFADRDARAFAAWLQSRAGGSVTDDHLMLLINEQATMGNLSAALDWLIEQSEESDQAILYFSGHGDMEANLLNELGFLLLWDSPPHAYIAGGAWPVDMLKQVVTTLSIEKKAQVLMVVDACRSGKLAGNNIIGTQLTNANLMKQFTNEQKILSCQPNEYSIEGEQWGGGRGVFSYFLLQGLAGMADENHNGGITLLEIKRYLENNVPPSVAPLTQIPLALGDQNSLLAEVDTALLAAMQSGKPWTKEIFGHAERRGKVSEVLKKADAREQKTYTAFEKALREKRFFEPAGDCADEYYSQLLKMPSMQALSQDMKRNYAAALQNDAQQSINALLKIEVEEVVQAENELLRRYRNFPRELERSAELLGPQHYMYKNLKARQRLFEGALLYFGNLNSRDTAFWQMVLNTYRQSLNEEPDSPVAHFFMSRLFAVALKEPDSAYAHAVQAMRYAPSWSLPYAYVAFIFTKSFGRFSEAKVLLDKAMEVDSADVFTWKSLGAWHFYQRRYSGAIQAYQKAIQIYANDAVAWADLGIALLSNRQIPEAEQPLLKSIQLDTSQYIAYYYLGILYERTHRNAEAEKMYWSAVRFNADWADAHHRLAILYSEQNQLDKAEQQFEEIIRINPSDAETWYNLACLASKSGRQALALARLKTALEAGFTEFDYIRKDPDLDAIRMLPDFTSLLEKHISSAEKH